MGRARFLEYIVALENVVADALAATKPVQTTGTATTKEGWSPA